MLLEITCPGFYPTRLDFVRVRHMGVLTGSTQYDRILYRHPATGVEVVHNEDDLNRSNRDYTDPVSEADAVRLSMQRDTRSRRQRAQEERRELLDFLRNH